MDFRGIGGFLFYRNSRKNQDKGTGGAEKL